jgi:hypothetical protein
MQFCHASGVTVHMACQDAPSGATTLLSCGAGEACKTRRSNKDIPTAQELDDPLRRLDLLRADASQPIRLRRAENQGPSTSHCTGDWSAAQVVAHAPSPTCDP